LRTVLPSRRIHATRKGRALENRMLKTQEERRLRGGENFILKNILIYILRRILFGLLNVAACRIMGEVRNVRTVLLRGNEVLS
jgi:hypothetical protein